MGALHRAKAMTARSTLFALSLSVLGCGLTGGGGGDDQGKRDTKQSAHSEAIGICNDERPILDRDDSGAKAAAEAWHACVAKANRGAVAAIDEQIDVEQFGSSAVQIDAFEDHAATFCKKVAASFVGEFTGSIEAECQGSMSNVLGQLIDHYVSFGELPTAELPLDRHHYMPCYGKLDPALEAAVSTADYIQAFGEMRDCVLQDLHDRTDQNWIEQIKLDSTREVALQIINDAYASAEESIGAACTLVHNSDDNAGGTAARITVSECGADSWQLVAGILLGHFSSDL